jgi:hypothetical protein
MFVWKCIGERKEQNKMQNNNASFVTSFIVIAKVINKE